MLHYTLRTTPQTGEWFLHNPQYLKWLGGETKCFFCTGLPGAGKSHLASVVVNDIQQNHQNDAVGLGWIYFRYDSVQRPQSSDVLRSVLRQLLTGQPTIPDELVALYKKHVVTMITDAQCELWLNSIAQTLSKVHLIVDALDECSNNDDGRNAMLRSLIGLSENCFLFITSRPSVDIMKHFVSALNFSLEANANDIEKYILERLYAAANLAEYLENDDQLQSKIVQRILELAQGM